MKLTEYDLESRVLFPDRATLFWGLTGVPKPLSFAYPASRWLLVIDPGDFLL